MQALSHFSYHITGGSYVLCDLQGGIYQHQVILSDPVMLSRFREYGVTRPRPGWHQQLLLAAQMQRLLLAGSYM